MKRAVVILVLGLFAGAAGYFGCVFFGTASGRNLFHHPTPELAWLKKEFNLSDAEYARISQLHAAYLPACQERCQRIAAKNAELKDLLARTNTLTSEIETKLTDAARLRAECQAAMLKHFYEVSANMPPAQGRRYLAWVQEKTFLSDHGMRRTAESSG